MEVGSEVIGVWEKVGGGHNGPKEYKGEIDMRLGSIGGDTEIEGSVEGSEKPMVLEEVFGERCGRRPRSRVGCAGSTGAGPEQGLGDPEQ